MIRFDKERDTFLLTTPSTSYIMCVSKDGYLGHVYYGKKIEDTDVAYLMKVGEEPYNIPLNKAEEVSFFDCYPMEYQTEGVGDFRETCFDAVNKYGQGSVKLRYVSHTIYEGKRSLTDLPATWGDNCDSLDIELEDCVFGVRIILTYTAFRDVDAITRSVRVVNTGDDNIIIKKVLSASLDFDADREYEVMSLHGSWARERRMQRVMLGYGNHEVSSKRGESSHQDHPFMAVMTKGTSQDSGEVYAMNFVYSGNFVVKAGKDQFDKARMVMGINPDRFSWRLAPEEEFQAPEVVMVYSDRGLSHMTATFHDLYRTHLVRGNWRDKERPVLINNWEATYFDFDNEKLLDIAREASKRGIEMLVMDDGWFGDRSEPTGSLGDWKVNEDKLKGGLKKLVDEVNALGLKFGIWFEPEMVSEDSELYRQHPDWALGVRGREGARARDQYVLDLSRDEVCDAVYEQIKEVLMSANIEYVKWDMNRPLTDIGNVVAQADRQGEISHRYMLNVYRMQDRLITDFPNLLLENCSSGGARFDPGMLYYSPQIWCSDDIDPIERLTIHEGTALIYPLSTIGSHVAVSPNHTTGRETPFDTRGVVALFGTFGYELDITKLSDEDKEKIEGQVAQYKRYNHLMREGDYYRIESYTDNSEFDCYEVVSKDKKEAVVVCVQVKMVPNKKARIIKLKGLKEDALYQVQGRMLRGQTLKNAGILVERKWGDNQAEIIYIKRV